MFTKRNNRRQFLKLASGLMAAPLGSMSFFANGQVLNQKPLRFLTIIDHFGVPPATRKDTWIDSTTGDYPLSNNDLGTILQPLSDYLDNMLVVSGIDLDSQSRGGAPRSHHEFVPHTVGGSCTLEGSGQREASARLSHESLDVLIGNYLHNNLSNSRVHAHRYFTDYSQDGVPTYCFDTSGILIRSIPGARSAIENSFSGSGPEGNPVLQAELLAQKDLLDKVSGRVQLLKGQLGNASYHEKLDAYDTSVSELARQLEVQQGQSCETPNAGNFSAGRRNLAESERGDVLKVIGQLFACDMVSSVTYAFGGELFNQHRHNFISSRGDSEVEAGLNRNMHGTSHDTGDVGNKAHEYIRIHQSELIAELMDTLSTTLDIDGSPILDNTVIYVPSCMAHNTHQNTNYATLILAGKNTNLIGGRHYDCGEFTNNELLTTLAQGVNVPITEFGGYHVRGHRVDSLNSGPISKMLKTVHSS